MKEEEEIKNGTIQKKNFQTKKQKSSPKSNNILVIFVNIFF